MKNQLDDIKMIREMMEKSTKFISLHGFSGVFAGFFALIGAAVGYHFVLDGRNILGLTSGEQMTFVVVDAVVVLILSIGFALLFSGRKAHKQHQQLFNRITLKVFYHLAIPLVSGGVFAFIFLLRGDLLMVESSTLVFYGLALINASKFTMDEIHYLGITEVVLGILSAIFAFNGLLFWAIGFGLCHIVYGVIMYLKYDRSNG